MTTTARKLLVIPVFCLIALAMHFAVVGEPAYAQENPPPAAGAKPSTGKAPKRTSINFEDQLVEGQTQKPELFYLLQQRNNNYKRLIRLRENFLPEMRKTAEDVTR